MLITITVETGPHRGRVFTFAGHDTFLVGRSKHAHLQLPAADRYCSRIHFMVEVNPPCCRLMDMGSNNGTHINDHRVATAELHDCDRIRAGRTVLAVSFQGAEPPLPRAPEAAATVDYSLNPGPPSAFAAVGLPDAGGASCLGCGGQVRGVPAAGPLCAACRELVLGQPQPIPGHEMVRELGRGGMGIVYLALCLRTGEPVALKKITPALAATRAQVEKFLREADILRQLRHPHIVAFREMGQAHDDLYFTMDYVRGVDAGGLLKRHGPLPVTRAVELVCQLLEGLGHAHARGFVHRDIKPSNLLIEGAVGQEVARLADFGLARVYHDSQLSGLTLLGDVGGTTAFMAPEQITHYRECQPPADQYATAATLYTLLTGRRVYDLPAELQDRFLMILHQPPVPIQERLPALPDGLARAIQRALERDPGKRFPDAAAFRAALLPFRTEGA
jgi:serine/threonine-protein kinase